MRRLKEKGGIPQIFLALTGLFGLYLVIAWASYSPLDNAWSVASTATSENVLNKTGYLGAWVIDLLYAFWGRAAALVPFALTFASVYALFHQWRNRITFNQILFRLMSFLLFMVGVAGVMGGILGHSPHYLSGGVIGGIWQNLLYATIGQFGTLLIAMIFTAIGFYFCSGQTLIQISTQFYEWVTAKNEGNKKQTEVNAENRVDLQNTSEISPLATSPLSPFSPQSSVPDFLNESSENSEGNESAGNVYNEEQNKEQNGPLNVPFTDPSVFKRPNIKGLAPTVDLQEENASISTNKTMFEVESNLELPRVNVEDFNPQPMPQPMPQAVEEASAFTHHFEHSVEQEPVEETLDLPKVYLNTATPVFTPVATPAVQAVEKSENVAESYAKDIRIQLAPESPVNPQQVEVVQERGEPQFEPTASGTLPQVKLSPFSSPFSSPSSSASSSLANDEDLSNTFATEEDFEAQRAREFEEMEKARLAERKARAEAEGLGDTFNQITAGSGNFTTNLPQNVQVRTEPTPSVFPFLQTLSHAVLQNLPRLRRF